MRKLRKKLFGWAVTPLFVPRWMLAAKYVAFILLGVSIFLWGNTTLSLATFDGYTTLWAAGVVLTAAFSLPGTFKAEFEASEKWMALILSGLIVTWSFAAIWRAVVDGDLDRIPGAWAIFMLSMLPAARSFGLLRGK